MQFNLDAINNTMARYINDRTHTNLSARIGLDEFRNHVSCVFSFNTLVLSPWMDTTLAFKELRLVGFTPCYPMSNPNATSADNQRYRAECKRQLKDRSIMHLDAMGEALDFPQSPGCFIALVDSLTDLDFVLNDQLSCLVVDASGKTQLHSLID